METYDDPRGYTGAEWGELLRAMSPRELRRTLRAAYRREGAKIAAIARRDLAGSGIRNGGRMGRGVRVRVYSRGGGFMVTVKPHGRSGYYTNSAGRQKPVAMWAAEGTSERWRRGWVYSPPTGRMPSYHFMEAAEREAGGMVERDLGPEIELAAIRQAARKGWK